MTCFLYPDIGRVDEPVLLHMDGFTPHEKITIKAKWIDTTEQRWQSTIFVKSDANGKIQLTDETSETNLQSLLWNLKPANPSYHSSVLQKTSLTPIDMTITVVNEANEVVLERTLTRLFIEDHIEREVVRTPECHGTFFYPKEETSVPAIIMLGGSEGGIYEESAALLSAQGYAVLSLAYFGETNLPATLHEVPVETVDHAVEWLQEKTFVNQNEIACMGTSKGGELALLAAAHNPNIHAVIGEVPASHVFQSIDRKKWKSSSWTIEGNPVPYVPYSYSVSITLQSMINIIRKRPQSLEPMYRHSLEKYRSESNEAVIRVEKINGPILLLSGGEDALWPSGSMCESIMERLDAHTFPYEKKHLYFEKAGHVLPLPYLPSILPADVPFELGGTERANAEAGEKAWQEILAFLSRHFHPVKPKVETVMLQK